MKKSQDNVKNRLSPLQYEVTQQCGTEPAFKNAYWDNHEPGLYVDLLSGAPLFSSTDKFDSGTGWPSFIRPLTPDAVTEKKDKTHGMVRTEVRSQTGHLGHVFPDGPRSGGGLRYCINSAALKFIPVKDLYDQGYGKYLFLFPEYLKKLHWDLAGFAGGCFWGTEEYFRRLPAVKATIVGYAGGAEANPTYEQVCSGRTGHAESVLVIYDPQKLSYADLLAHFWRIHDPTTADRQGNDRGSQYRPLIFYYNAEQKQQAELSRDQQARRLVKKIVTEILPAPLFYPAEEYHQEYLRQHPGGYCHVDLGLVNEPLKAE